MEKKYEAKRITFVQQACEKVIGFNELCQQFKKKMIIGGGSQSTFKNYSRQLASIALYYDRVPTLLTAMEIDDYLYHIKQTSASASETYFKHMVFSLRYVFRMTGQEYRCI